MSTAAFEASGYIDARVKELKSLLKQAKQIVNSDEFAYDAICRSCCVLLSSHIEGSMTDFASSAIRDLNYFHKDFSKMPTALKRNFCKKIAFFEGVNDKTINTRIDQLVKFFDTHTVPIDLDAITYLETSNNNPKPSSIEKPFEKLGITGTLNALGSDFLLQAFSGNEGKKYLAIKTLRKSRANLYSFPYSKPKEEIFNKDNRKKSTEENLWHTFLEEVVTRRNNIAHGKILENPTSAIELENDVFKMEVFLRAASTYLFSNVN